MAKNNVEYCYYNGQGVTQDYKKAFEYQPIMDVLKINVIWVFVIRMDLERIKIIRKHSNGI
jgi:hypothetical protein